MEPASEEEDIVSGEEHDWSEDDFIDTTQRLLNEGWKFQDIAAEYGIHRNTLRKYLDTYGWTGTYHQLSVEEVCSLIRQHCPLAQEGCNWGIRDVRATLQSNGHRISRRSVSEALHLLQPAQMERRRHGISIRFEYDVFEAMELWHIDSYDKLALWGIRIHGGIDGGSNYIV